MKDEIKNLKSENETIKINTERIDNNLNAIAINEGGNNYNKDDIDQVATPENIEIMYSIQNAGNNFRPFDIVKGEVNLDNKQIEKNLEKEFTLNDCSKAVALSASAEEILNKNK